MKRLLSILLTLCLFLPLPALAAEEADVDAVIGETAQYLINAVPSPALGSIGGEWAVLGLARSGISVPDGYFERYAEQITQAVRSRQGVLHSQKYTEYSRVILALTAIGKDPREVAGYDLTAPLGDFDKTVYQGFNGAAFALIALDAHSYALPQNSTATKERYLSYLLDAQLPDGGWALSGDASEPDMTAMILCALAPYRKQQAVSTAIGRALLALSQMQSETGGFPAYGVETAESSAQVLVALCALEISPDDARFVKGGKSVVDNLLSFRISGGFRHLPTDDSPNLMATEQAFYALVALDRFLDGKPALYDMKEVPLVTSNTADGLSGKHPDVSIMPITTPGKTFADIRNHPSQTAIETLAARGIINGKSESAFDPDSTMTRAEFATIVTRALGIPQAGDAAFADVRESDWFYGFVNTAYAYGIVKGVSDTEFRPNGTITREEAAVMVARAARLAGMDTAVGDPTNTLCLFTDYPTVSAWATESLAFCYHSGILSDTAMEILPKTPIRRAEIAQMLFEMLTHARLL